MTALALLVLAAFQSDPIGVNEYRDRLTAIRSAIDRKEIDAVRDGARDLQALRVRHEGGVLVPDPSVLGPLASAKDAAAARESVARLDALLEGLKALPDSQVPKPADPQLLERLRAEEAERERESGRRVGGPALHAPEIPQSWLEKAKAFLEAFAQKVGRFLMWLLRLLFSGPSSGAPGSSTQFLVALLVIGVLGALGVVAVVALRRKQAVATPTGVSEAPAMSTEDDDPLSRTANEWERFAVELMKGGRFREAIRAWYHAVLVTLFRSGALHYRKDRTNWEYAFALPSTVEWRPRFLEATRTFEREWYGRRNSEAELAEAYQQQAQGILTEIHERGAR